jgi:hypothetical protein
MGSCFVRRLTSGLAVKVCNRSHAQHPASRSEHPAHLYQPEGEET